MGGQKNAKYHVARVAARVGLLNMYWYTFCAKTMATKTKKWQLPD